MFTIEKAIMSSSKLAASYFLKNTPRNLSIPSVGFGTFDPNLFINPTASKDAVRIATLEALEAGYRHIDTAFSYGSEKEVGKAIAQWIAEGKGRREDLWVTSKLYNTFHKPEDVRVGIEISLKDLGLDYVDLYLMHFPTAYVPGENYATKKRPDGGPVVDIAGSRDFMSTWRAMEVLVDTGHTKAIGISNFSLLKTKRLLSSNPRILPAINQIELHPYLPQHDLIAFLTAHGIHATAHSPLGGRPVPAVALNAHLSGPLTDPTILSIAGKYDKSPAQVLLSWGVQRGTSIVPKSASKERIRENSELFILEKSDMVRINEIWKGLPEVKEGKQGRRANDPSEHTGFDIYSEEREEP